MHTDPRDAMFHGGPRPMPTPNFDEVVNAAAPPPPNQMLGSPCMPMAMRQSARGLIQMRIAELRNRISTLEALDSNLPAKLNQKDDEAIWHLICTMRI